jgi:hypothetical protein
LITLMIDARSAADTRSKKDLSSAFQPTTYFACQAYPALLAAGQGWFVRTRSPDLPNMLPLYDFKHPRRSPQPGRARTSFDIPEKILVEPVGIEPTT